MGNSRNSKESNIIITEEGLAFDDVLLVPQYSEILPSDVILTTRLTKNIELKTINNVVVECFFVFFSRR